MLYFPLQELNFYLKPSVIFLQNQMAPYREALCHISQGSVGTALGGATGVAAESHTMCEGPECAGLELADC